MHCPMFGWCHFTELNTTGTRQKEGVQIREELRHRNVHPRNWNEYVYRILSDSNGYTTYSTLRRNDWGKGLLRENYLITISM